MIWREAMAQLRQLNNDMWNGVRFFLTINGVIIVAIYTIAFPFSSLNNVYFILTLAVFGFVLTIIAFFILRKQRDYYIDMLQTKTLLEKELKFYEIKIDNIHLSFPWNVEKEFIDKMIKNDNWKTEQRWRIGTISHLLMLTYLFVFIIYSIIIICIICCIICSAITTPH